MESAGSDWYKTIWTLDIKKHGWVEDTRAQVDFLIRALALKGDERILDLACGFGRHALELAERGFRVVGLDITPAYIEDAARQARERGLNAEFILSDLRDAPFDRAFDAVLSLGDGAVGYLENEAENLKLFDVVARALKPGGRHFMDIMSADYARTHFPCQLWDAGEQGLTLSKFEWDSRTQIMLYGQLDTAYGAVLEKPVFSRGNPTRLYGLEEIRSILLARGMRIEHVYADYRGAPACADRMQMLVCSRKSEA